MRKIICLSLLFWSAIFSWTYVWDITMSFVKNILSKLIVQTEVIATNWNVYDFSEAWQWWQSNKEKFFNHVASSAPWW